METKTLEDLKPDPRNPRTLSKTDADALSHSLDTFGDLGPVVFNVRTQQLIGGHQRVELFKRLPGERRVIITQRYEHPDEVGTVALGHIFIGNKSYAYREVDWPEGTQRAANIAANRISGDFDQQLLAEVTYELSQLDSELDLLTLTGQSEDEVAKLLKSVGVGADDEIATSQNTDDQADNDKLTVALTRDQRLIVERALEHIKAHCDLQAVEKASLNGAALFVLAAGYLDRVEAEEADQSAVEPTGELIDIPG